MLKKKTRIFNEEVFKFFKNEELKNEKLDLIFLDPPYREENIKIILENIAKLKLLKESGLVVLHRHKKSKDEIGERFLIKRFWAFRNVSSEKVEFKSAFSIEVALLGISDIPP